jgi:uncharacterized Zn-binding protein involved in type VI secretion
MPVTVKVNGAVNSLVHKGSNGVSVATIPDVCKTPSPGGPVPIPYPNISQSITLAKGTTTVKADGMMIAIKGSEFSLSNGDNAGVAGGVKSSTFMKESTWILYSFDVKMDGKNACRLTDKKFQNHENTVDLAGCAQPSVTVAGIELTKLCCDCIKAVDFDQAENLWKKINASKAKNKQKPLPEELKCTLLGVLRHSCVSKALKEQDSASKGVHSPGGRNYNSNALGGRQWCRPDIIVTQPNVNGPPIDATQIDQIYEMKFQCNKQGEPLKSAKEWDPDKQMSPAQRRCYEQIKLDKKKGGTGQPNPEGVEVNSIAPTSENCDVGA